jgi:peptidyl-prolyl cis-trans isomerase B (cyclophilin B)
MPLGITFEKKDPRAIISTKFGDMTIKLYPGDAPRHVENFIKLAKMGFYNGVLFHRAVPGFLIQGGDPLSKTPDRTLHGTGGPGYWLNPEPSDRPHKRGAVSMAKMPRESNSTRDFNDNGSQFFICVADSSGLDRRYSIFGEVIRGMEVADKIAGLSRDERDHLLEPVEMIVIVKE